MPEILRGDARALPLPDDSVDLIVTSPPYFGLRSYTDGGEHYDGQVGAEATPQEFIAALIECTREMVRVLKPSGSIFLNLGDKYAGSTGGGPPSASSTLRGNGHVGGGPKQQAGAGRASGRALPGRPKSLMLLPERYRIAAVDELGLIARAVLVWSKPNGLPESVTDRVRRSHEDWVHLTKAPRYFASVDEIREQYAPATLTRNTNGRAAHRPASYTDTSRGVLRDSRPPMHEGNPLGKLPGSVWEIATQPLKVPAELGVDHFAAFPMEWPRRLIQGWCPPDGVVLDPFGGTGTTALVATMLGRRGISVDLSADYCRLAEWRASDPKQRERASTAAKRKPRPEVVEPEAVDLSAAVLDPVLVEVAAACSDEELTRVWERHAQVWGEVHTAAARERLAQLVREVAA